MPSQAIRFDGVDVSAYFSTWQETANSRINTAIVPRRHGLLINDTVVEDARTIQVTGTIDSPDGTQLGLRTVLDMLSELFTHRNAPLQLWDDRFLNAWKSGFAFKYIEGSGLRAVDFSLTFICADPFWYENEDDLDDHDLTLLDTPLDITNSIYRREYTIENDSSALVYPEITVSPGLTPLAFVVVRNMSTGRWFKYTGTVAVGTSLVAKMADFLVLNNGVDDLAHFDGDFLYLKTGANTIQIEGTAPASYRFSWRKRYV
jgi:phage-related protein